MELYLKFIPHLIHFDIISALACRWSNANHLPVEFQGSPVDLTNSHSSRLRDVFIYSYLDGFVLDAHIFIIAKHPQTLEINI